MDFQTFTQQHFAGDAEKATRHLVRESYYHDCSLTGSREDLQAVLDSMTKEEAKVYMRFFKEAVKHDRDQARKDSAPLLDIMRGTDTSWQFDEEYIRKGNPFGKALRKSLVLSAIGIGVLIVLYFVCEHFGLIEGSSWFAGVCAVCGAAMAGRILSAASQYRIFKKAEKKLQKS